MLICRAVKLAENEEGIPVRDTDHVKVSFASKSANVCLHVVYPGLCKHIATGHRLQLQHRHLKLQQRLICWLFCKMLWFPIADIAHGQ